MTTQPLSALKMLLSRHTKRREFIALLSGAAVTWPLAARAQQTEKRYTVGILSAGSENTAVITMAACRADASGI